ncbi:EF-P 5-aminopentanol modification-associated protein YfmF [Virgibacillus kekensis]|uniref:EF-P 5-aminopentanol modification-associated protein YfmF n=1 Tax=Virgibacillus kekensis TaxID=202261 RepID=A0ABV9DEQ5_9BACI
MDTPLERIIENDGVNLHVVPSRKFKTITFTAKFKAPLSRNTITKRALLPYVLQQGTESYPSRSSVQLKLDSLYGAVLSINGSKKGNHHILTIRLEVANQKYIPDADGIMDEAISLLKEVIFHPVSENNAFKESVINREKDTLKQKIDSVIDDKMSYANMRLIDEMCADEAYKLHVQGYKEDFDGITASNLFSYYQSLLKEDQLDFYVLGDIDADEVTEKVKGVFQGQTAVKDKQENTESKKQMEQPNIVTEKQQLQQAKLHFGYRTNVTYRDDEYYALQVFNGLFGGFPSSKLFINVREKNSLAYYAASRIESHKGLLFVFSGIAPEDYEKAKEIIEQQMDAMCEGDFTEGDIANTKELITNQLLETMDNSQGIVEMLYQQVAGETERSPQELIDGIKGVSKQEVVNVARKITLDTIYLLTKEGGGQNE